MKLDKLKFARVIAHCVSNGMSAGEYEVDTLDNLIDIEVPVNHSPTDLDNLLMQMANGTNKIEAIRTYRLLTGAGLKDAKEGVERYWVSKGHYQPEATLGDILKQATDKPRQL